ncbi:MAG: T9SS type A sorting domain-containing protein [Flavobacteriales bacterium]|nr:T9SS type A sorting domain-containing protein [Flavobacteriales bacterium]
MKHFYTALFLLFGLSALAQTTHQVDVGGSGGVDPFYDPQLITIDQGDIVMWVCSEGFHSVTTEAGAPESFNFGPQSAPWEFEFTFDVPGDYDYSCTVGNHAATQFGTITVLEVQSVTATPTAEGFSFYPNPAGDVVTIQGIQPGATLNLLNIAGEAVASFGSTGVQLTINLSELPSGLYFLEMRDGEVIRRERLIIRH